MAYFDNNNKMKEKKIPHCRDSSQIQ